MGPIETELHQRHRERMARMQAAAAKVKQDPPHGRPLTIVAQTGMWVWVPAPQPPEPEPETPILPVRSRRLSPAMAVTIAERIECAATPQNVVRLVAEHYGVTPAAIKSPSRKARVARLRQIAMWLSRRVASNPSWPHIGRSLGGRDHTTALHGFRKIERLRGTDPELAAELSTLEAAARERFGLEPAQ